MKAFCLMSFSLSPTFLGIFAIWKIRMILVYPTLMGLWGFVGWIWFHKLWIFKFRSLPALVFLSNPFNSLASSVSVEGCKRITEGKKKRKMKIPSKFLFYLGFQQPFSGWRNSSWSQWKWSHLPDKVLKYTSCFDGW